MYPIILISYFITAFNADKARKKVNVVHCYGQSGVIYISNINLYCMMTAPSIYVDYV